MMVGRSGVLEARGGNHAREGGGKGDTERRGRRRPTQADT